MHFLKKNINSSPFVGIFCCLSDKICIVPKNISKKDEEEIRKNLHVRVIKASLANSSIVGVIGIAFEEKLVVPEIVEKHEIRFLEEHGVEVMKVNETAALGNLVSLNQNGGIASSLLEKKTVKQVEKFLGPKIAQKDICGSRLAGSCIEANGKGFVVNPHANEKEFLFLEKTFNVQGVMTTVNYGDRFVGNDIVANNHGVIIGSITTTHEMIRIDEAFRRG